MTGADNTPANCRTFLGTDGWLTRVWSNYSPYPRRCVIESDLEVVRISVYTRSASSGSFLCDGMEGDGWYRVG